MAHLVAGRGEMRCDLIVDVVDVDILVFFVVVVVVGSALSIGRIHCGFWISENGEVQRAFDACEFLFQGNIMLIVILYHYYFSIDGIT